MKTTEVFLILLFPYDLKMISDPGPFYFTKSSGSLTKMLSSGTLSVGLTDAISVIVVTVYRVQLLVASAKELHVRRDANDRQFI